MSLIIYLINDKANKRMPTSLSFYRYEKQLNTSHSENAFKSFRNFQQENKNLFYFH